MLLKIVMRDIKRNKIINTALFLFILVAALLVSSSSNIIIELTRSMNQLFTLSQPPHFAQMHAGDIDQEEIDKFAASNKYVKLQQTSEMINIDGTNIFFKDSQTTEDNSVMDNSFVLQNKQFDYLLNLDNQIINVAEGEIAVPIYYMQQKDMSIGDKVKIIAQPFMMEFTVTEFVRDVQMNPSIISSKRFVIHESDFHKLKNNIGEIEYLIEFLLTDIELIKEFSNQYQSSTLPQKGPAIDYNLIKLLNMLTDGIIAAVIILVSLLLIGIALLCLRLTMLATLEEEYKEISIMKAIGIADIDLKKVYLSKYMVIAGVASIFGYIISIFSSKIFTSNISLYMGNAEKSLIHILLPIIVSGLVFIIVVCFCQFTLRKIKHITAIAALRASSIGESNFFKGMFLLRNSRLFNVNVIMGLKDVLGRLKLFGILCLVFIISSFIIIVPVNLLNTLQSPDFLTYMGLGYSDVRIDLRQSEDIVTRFEDMVEYIEKDQDVRKFSPLVTSRYKILNKDGVYENINVESGDFTIFPLRYTSGTAPNNDSQIAISSLNARELEKAVGDTLQLIIGGQARQMLISGIYQDVTNGGKTAKALIPYDKETVLWYVLSLDLKPDINIGNKVDEYTEVFYPAKATHIEEYLSQTFGATIKQLKLVAAGAIMIAIFISMLITSLFLKMLIAKDSAAIAIKKSLGFKHKDIQIQYSVKMLLILAIGITIGTIAANTIGQEIIGLMGSMVGASQIQFVINPLVTYVVCPLALITTVALTTIANIRTAIRINITKMINE